MSSLSVCEIGWVGRGRFGWVGVWGGGSDNLLLFPGGAATERSQHRRIKRRRWMHISALPPLTMHKCV